MSLKSSQLCLYVSCWLFLNGLSVTTTDITCTVSISQGNLLGIPMASLFSNSFCGYFGIPYALPPIGSLRFKEPQPAAKWSGILNSRERKKLCTGIAYYKLETDEDCLYLDIYTPQITEESNSKYPVLVYIPGDTYLGDDSYLYVPDYLMRKEFVLVIINFRVGVLGFLSTGTSAALGNYGLKDQVEALKWIKNNIEGFGGDPGNVTIYGHGIGGACVHYHILSPMSTGLFHRAISQSGNALNPHMRPSSDPGRLVKQLGQQNKCQNKNDDELINCLRGLNANEFVNITSISFAPAIETTVPDIESFLTQHPVEIIRSRNFNKVPWIIGNVNNEGAGPAMDLILNGSLVDMWNRNPDDILAAPTILDMLEDKNLLDKHWTMILDFYLGNKSHNISTANIDELMQLYGDRLYYFGSHMSAVLHHLAGHDEIYKYNFNFNGTAHIRNYANALNSHVGTDHGDDLLYIFKLPTVRVFSFGQPEIQIVSTLTQIVTDFVKSGDPVSSMNIIWNHSAYLNNSEVHISYMDITTAELSKGLNLIMKNDLFHDRMQLWLSLPLYESDIQYSFLNCALHLFPMPILTALTLTVLIFGIH